MPPKVSLLKEMLHGFEQVSINNPLDINYGGTSTNSLPSGVLIGNGTNAITAKSAPSGSIVGTSDTQTLTNKDLSSDTNTFPTSLVTLSDIFKH